MNTSGRLHDLYSRPLPSAPAWVSDGILVKGGIMLMGGPAKIGKSWLLINAAQQLATGQALWGMWEVPKPVPTLYIDRELGIYGYHERVAQFYRAAGVEPAKNLWYLSKPPGMFLDTTRGIELLAKELDQTKAKVIILDPVSRCLIGDENSNTDVNHLFQNLDKLLAADPDLSIILSHHYGKPPKGDAREDFDALDPYNFRGAAKWFDAPDTLVMFARQEGQPGEWWRLRCRTKLRHGKDSEDKIFAIEEGGIVAPRSVEAPAIKLVKSWSRR